MFRNPAIPFFFILICYSCTVKQLSINILRPSVYSLPDSVDRLSVLPVILERDHFDSLRYMIPSKENIADIKREYLAGITDVFSVSPAFERVVYSDTTGNNLENGRLYWENLRKLCEKDSTRSVLILASSTMLDYPFIKSDVIYSWEGYTLFSKTKWVFFDPFSERALAFYNFNDTIQITGDWVAPEIDWLMAATCYKAGEKAGKSLSPYWIEVHRSYYTSPDRYMRNASKLVKKGKWNQAALIWNVLAENEDTTLASRASFNLALAYEMIDDLDQAVLWIEYADSLSSDTTMRAYKNALYERLVARKILDQQITK